MFFLSAYDHNAQRIQHREYEFNIPKTIISFLFKQSIESSLSKEERPQSYTLLSMLG